MMSFRLSPKLPAITVPAKHTSRLRSTPSAGHACHTPDSGLHRNGLSLKPSRTAVEIRSLKRSVCQSCPLPPYQGLGSYSSRCRCSRTTNVPARSPRGECPCRKHRHHAPQTWHACAIAPPASRPVYQGI